MDELEKRKQKAEQALTSNDHNIDEKYKKWISEIEDAAFKTIGKTTFKNPSKPKVSKAVKEYIIKKKNIKQRIQQEKEKENKLALIAEYKIIQSQSRNQIVSERVSQIKEQLENIIDDPSHNAFWREKRRITRNPVLESLIIKDMNGQRQFEPNLIKEHTAAYFENLYKPKAYTPHIHHNVVQNKIKQYLTDTTYDNASYNKTPTIEEIHNIIQNKKNGKSTTDLKNEILKIPGDVMTNFIYPLITTIWNEEKIPNKWNEGQITALWKGKGDKENLTNYRGITTSSSIGTIIEAAIDKRIESIVPLTQAQGGGKKGTSTYDHLFILRSIIDISKKTKNATYLTFFDVSKAYDNADNADMLSIVWEKGLRGKVWRILYNLNKDLTALVKTRFGPTRAFDMKIGGRQGSRITGRLFSKMMDTLSEELLTKDYGLHLTEGLIINCLLWVDDVLSIAKDEQSQIKTLEVVNEFAIKHKLKWGQEKCKVMRIGDHGKNVKEREWNLGCMTINEAKEYRYLGDVISNDGKNVANLESRKRKMQITTANINSIATSEVLSKIETPVLLELHDKVTIPGLINNAESWTLTKTEYVFIETAEIQALKYLFALPSHFPTPALVYSFGTLFTHIRIEIKRLIYLHRILKRTDTHWTVKTFNILLKHNIGWAKSITKVLLDFDLPTNFSTIKSCTFKQWKKLVHFKAEVKNKQRLLNECHKKINGVTHRKSKTAHIVDLIDNTDYVRGTRPEFQSLNKHETKAILLARFRMLECGVNYKGTLKEMCNVCKKIDDENHRLNHCVKFRSTNFCDRVDKVHFETVYTDDKSKLKEIVPILNLVWNTRNANGTMVKP